MRPEEEIGDRADFLEDLGGDSLDILDAVVELERVTGLTIPEEEYTQCRCVQDVAELLCRLEAGEKAAPAGAEREPAPRRIPPDALLSLREPSSRLCPVRKR